MTIDVHTDHFHIRTITPSDADNFMMVRSEASDVAIAYFYSVSSLFNCKERKILIF